MKVFILSNPVAIHTQRWVKSLSERGVEIMLYSFRPYREDVFYRELRRVEIRSFSKERSASGLKSNLLFKLFWYYIPLIRDIKYQIRQFKPDMVHAHCISDNGLFGVLSAFHPFVVSVWGTDIFDYPSKGTLRERLIRFILKRADYILSTSHAMAKETHKYTSRPIGITPFGVDVDLFKKNGDQQEELFTVGIVKTLEYGYGIDILMDAFARFNQKYPDTKLRIIGGGSLLTSLTEQAERLGISKSVVFEGKIAHHLLPGILNQFDLFVALSRSESFGVAVIEAMAAGCPVIVSDAPGFVEIVEDGVNGLLVPRENPVAAAEAMERLFLDAESRSTLAKNGRKRVEELYDWTKNVDTMISIYEQIKK